MAVRKTVPGSKKTYLIARLASAVNMARYIDGSIGHESVCSPFDPTRIPREARMLTTAVNKAKIPESGPKRRKVALHECAGESMLPCLEGLREVTVVIKIFSEGFSSCVESLMPGRESRVSVAGGSVGEYNVSPLVGDSCKSSSRSFFAVLRRSASCGSLDSFAGESVSAGPGWAIVERIVERLIRSKLGKTATRRESVRSSDRKISLEM
jgi:hypothetical protein